MKEFAMEARFCGLRFLRFAASDGRFQGLDQPPRRRLKARFFRRL